MNELDNGRLHVIGAEIRALTATMLSNIVEIGRRMTEARDLLSHGEFLPWLEENTGYRKSTAYNFMKLYDAYGDKQGSLFGVSVNVQTFGNLPYSKALALLSVPESEREGFAKEVDAEHISVNELKKAIAERDEEKQKAAALKEQVSGLEDQIRELEKRPVEVAVQEPSEEQIQRAAEARIAEEVEKYQQGAEAAKKQERMKADKLEADLKKAKDALKKARDELSKEKANSETAYIAGEEAAKKKMTKAQAEAAEKVKRAEAEAERLRGQLEELRKKAAMNDSAVAEFKGKFQLWQQLHNEMMEIIKGTEAETAEKLRAAMEKTLEVWRG